MGFRSDVSLIVYGNPTDLNAYVTAWKEDNRDVAEWVKDNEHPTNEIEVADCHDVSNSKKYAIYRLDFEWIKWYHDYDDIKVLYRLLENLPDSCAGELAQVHEDNSSEYDTYGNSDIVRNLCYVECKISFDY